MYLSTKGEDVRYEIQTWLKSHGASEEDQNLIVSEIKRGKKNEDLWYTTYELDRILFQQNPELAKLFHEASDELGIKWTLTTNIDEIDLKSY